jgi:hypothetical protein
MSKELAVENSFNVTKTPQGAWTPGTPNWTKVKADKVKANGEKVLTTTLVWTMSGCTMPAYNFTSGGGSMSPTGSKCKCMGQLPLRKGDKGNCSGMFVMISSPFTPLPCSCQFEITNAGQTKVKGE